MLLHHFTSSLKKGCGWHGLILNGEGEMWDQLTCRIQDCVCHVNGESRRGRLQPPLPALAGTSVPALSFILHFCLCAVHIC